METEAEATESEVLYERSQYFPEMTLGLGSRKIPKVKGHLFAVKKAAHEELPNTFIISSVPLFVNGR